MSESVLPVSESLLHVPESAGHASCRSFDHSDPLYPLQLDACDDWNADTGATSHMTPHRHWLHNYVPKRIPIKLADNKTVYSAGQSHYRWQGTQNIWIYTSLAYPRLEKQPSVCPIPHSTEGIHCHH